MTASIVGFKTPQADLHRKSPKIFISCMMISLLLVIVGIQVPILRERNLDKKIVPPPVIIQLENIPETRHQVTVPAPKLAIPIEVENDVMPDDVTIESTNLNLNAPAKEVAPMVELPKPESGAEAVEEEVYELHLVQEPPVQTEVVKPEYPKAALEAKIHGTVFVRALIGTDGTVEKAEIVKGPDALQDAALKAVLQWKFKPAKMNDKAVRCWVSIPVRFEN
ncbi:TonB family protein [bacterium]|nr:TonB family protein [bacterium]